MQTQDKQTATIAADYPCKFNTRDRKEKPCFLEVRQIITFDSAGGWAPHHRIHVPVELRLYGTGRINTACPGFTTAPRMPPAAAALAAAVITGQAPRLSKPSTTPASP